MSGFQSDPDDTPTQRRSKTEMVCDLMLAISGGAVRPTRIMQRANLTWNALLAYLHALAASGLVRRVEKGEVASYHLTEKGEEVLKSYLELKRVLAPLNLENIDPKTAVQAVRIPIIPQEAPEPLSFRGELEKEGYRVLDSSVRGKSGIVHEFGLVAKDRSGVVHGYVFVSDPDEKLILGLFVTQLDTGFRIHVVHKGEPTREAAERAKEYGIELVRPGPTRSPAP